MLKNNQVPVSVVIPFYNAASTIERALSSIVNQSRLPYEVIVVDDASQKEEQYLLEGIIKDLLESISIHLISLKTNSGPSVARNAGWDYASQPYIAFLDADDSWLPYKIEIQYKWMKENSNVALTSHICSYNPAFLHEIIPTKLSTKKITKQKLLISNFFSTPSVILKRNLPFRFDVTMKYSEDHLLWLQIVCNDYEAFFMDVKLAIVHKAPFGAGGLSSHIWKMTKAELIKYIKLTKNGQISYVSSVLLMSYALIKYLRRLFLSSN